MATRKVFFDTSCPTCTRSANAPFRVFGSDGSIVLGCVDHFHTGHVVNAHAAWHNSANGKRLRALDMKRRDGFVTELAA